MSRVTKLELEQRNAALAEENALLRSRISDLQQVASRLAEHNDMLTRNMDLARDDAALAEQSNIKHMECVARLQAQLVKATQARREDVNYLSKLHAAREEAIRTGKTVRVQ